MRQSDGTISDERGPMPGSRSGLGDGGGSTPSGSAAWNTAIPTGRMRSAAST